MMQQPAPARAAEVPTHWYNVLADHGIELPSRQASRIGSAAGNAVRLNVPRSLVRQSMPLRVDVPVPEPLLDAYREWRPTPLLRANRLERALRTAARVYVKDETRNVAGSHKYLTALAQSYYYAEAGVRTLVTSTAAGQWGTSVAAAARRFGLGCRIHVVPGSYDRKPGRRTVMEMLGAEVVRAPERSDGVVAGLREAMSRAVDDAAKRADTRWVLGGSEPFAILHTTLVGIETADQLDAAGETAPPVLVGYLGGGKNACGLAMPFLRRDRDRRPHAVRFVESVWYPVLTRGSYRYEESDDSGRSPRSAAYTLGRGHVGAPIVAEGMRYHSAPPLVSELYRRGLVQSVAHEEQAVMDSARLLLTTEGLLPSAEAAYAVHEACRQAVDPANADRPIVVCLSDHGHYDSDAYRAHLDGTLLDGGPEHGRGEATAG